MADTPADSTPTASPDPEPVTKAKRADFLEIGSTGLQQYGGFVRDEFLPQLQGDRAIKAYREMADNSPVVGGVLFAIDMHIRGVDWRLDPATTTSVEEMVEERRRKREEAIATAEAAAAEREAMQEALLSSGNDTDKPSGNQARSMAKELLASSPVAKSVTARRITQLLSNPHLPDHLVWRLAKAAVAADTSESDADARGSSGVSDGNQADAEYWAVFTESCLDDMSISWSDTISQALSMIPFGWHFAEVCYKKRMGQTGKDETQSDYNDGKIGWRKFAPRAQETRLRWEFADNGGVLGMWQLAPPQPTKFIPIEKALLFKPEDRKMNPEGRSSLRTAWTSYHYLKRLQEIEAIGIERNLAGLPVGWVPAEWMSPAATVDQIAAREAFKKIVRNVKRDEQEGMIMPLAFDPNSGNKMYDITLLQSTGDRTIDTDRTITRYEQRIAMSMLADFILLGHDRVGSQALGSVKSDLFTAAIEAWVDAIASVFNKFAIPRLMQVNGVDPSLAPKLSHGKVAKTDIGALGDFLLKLSQAGAPLFPDEELEAHVRDIGGLPGKTGREVDG